MQNKIMIAVPYLTDGGAERVASLWSNFLAKNNYKVIVLTYYQCENEYKLCDEIDRISLTKNKMEYEKIRFFAKISMLRKIINMYKPNIIIPFLSHMNIAVSLACNNKNVIVTQTIRNNPWINPRNYFFRKLRDFFVYKEKNLIVQNNEQLSYFKSKKINKYVVCNPVNPLISEYEKKDYSLINSIIAVGRLHKQKNYFFMVDVIGVLVKKYKYNVKLDIFGDGPEKDNIQKYINNKGLSNYIILKGRCNNILEIEKNYDLFIMTSLYEGFPNSLLEALAIGVPSISINCKTGPKDLITNEMNGILVDEYDVNFFANQILEMNKIEILKKYGNNSKKIMKDKYSQEICMNQLKDTIDSLIQYH